MENLLLPINFYLNFMNVTTPSDRLHVPNNRRDVLHLKEKERIFAFVLYSKVAPTEPQRDYFITVAILFLIKPKGNPSLSGGRLSKIQSQSQIENNPDIIEITALFHNQGNSPCRKYFKAQKVQSCWKVCSRK